MSSSKVISLKKRINNYAKKNNIASQVVLQNYMFECFLNRLSQSEYCEKFVIKGGMLIAAIVGLDTRSTMDLDVTLRNLTFTEGKVMESVTTICGMDLRDHVKFGLVSVAPIRKDDPYGGFRVRLDAAYDTILTPLFIDISTGDAITPTAVLYEFSGIFDESVSIRLWGYNIETVMAEKVETILNRGIFSTRPRDCYDIYILVTTQKYDKALFLEALSATMEHRGSREKLSDVESIIGQISESRYLQQLWAKYQQKFAYARDISYESIMDVLRGLLLR